MDVGFHSKFFVLGGRDVDWCLDLCHWLFGGVDFYFIIFLYGWGVGVACFGILRGQILFNFFLLYF